MVTTPNRKHIPAMHALKLISLNVRGSMKQECLGSIGSIIINIMQFFYTHFHFLNTQTCTIC